MVRPKGSDGHQVDVQASLLEVVAERLEPNVKTKLGFSRIRAQHRLQFVRLGQRDDLSFSEALLD